MTEETIVPIKTLSSEFLEEQKRVLEFFGAYREIGEAGLFGATGIQITLKKSFEAALDGDVVNMMFVYKELKEIN